jgi:hypothetical protein
MMDVSVRVSIIVNCDDNVIRCSYCNNQAVKTFTLESGDEVYSCCALLCDLRYLYLHNSDHLSLISLAEGHLKVTPAKVLIAHMTHPDSNINDRTKAGFLIPGGDIGTYLWSEIFSGETLEELEFKVAISDKVLGINRSIIITEEKLPYDKVSFSTVNRLEGRCVYI